MTQKIIEYLTILFGMVLLDDIAIRWIIAGSFLLGLVGFLMITLLSGCAFLYIIREILYYATKRKKDGQ